MDEVTVGGVRIVNNNEFTIADMFDGVPFTFEPGKAITIPPDAANHIFGWRPVAENETESARNNEMLIYCQKRHGWNTPDIVRVGEHTKRFGKLEFKAVRFRMVEVTEDEESLPTMATPRRPRKPHENKMMQAAAESEARRAGAE